MAVIYTPIFTYTGLNKISKALSDGSTIQLTHLAIGDCNSNIEYNVTPDDIALSNEKVRIGISTIKYTDMTDSNNVLMSIEGLMTPLESPVMTIREYGIYDNEGDLIIISRFPDKSTIEPGTPRSNFVFKTNIKLLRGQRVFIEDVYPADYITVEEFSAHVTDLNNPHNVVHTQIEGLENLDNTSVAGKPLNKELTDLFKHSKFTTGFKDRTSSKISNTNNTIKLEVITPIVVYKHGVRYVIENNLELIISNLNTHGYVAYNPTTGLLYYVGEVPTFGEDVLVSWYYANSTQGIIWNNDERHSATINSEDHRLRHNELGTLWNSGGILSIHDGHLLSITDISISDEDLDFNIVHSDTPTLPYQQVLVNAKLPVLYINNGRYVKAGGTNTENWLYGVNRAYYNNIDTGLVEVSNDKYINYYLIYTTDQYSPVKLIMGRNVFDTAVLAEEESIVSYGIPMLEIVTAYRITLHIEDAYNNNSKSAMVNIHRLENSGLENSTSNTNHSLFINRFNGIQHDVSVISDFEIITQPKSPTIEVELTGTFKGKSVLDVDTHLAVLDGYQSDRSKMPTLYGGATGDDFLKGEYIGTDYGSALAAKYYLATKADNGKIYAPPAYTNKVLRIDPATDTTSLVGTDYGTGVGKWIKFTKANNGKLYAAPASTNFVLMLDPTNDSTSYIGTDYGTVNNSKWVGGALAPNGKIYCPPGKDIGKVLKIDPDTNTTSLIGTDYGVNTSGKWYSAVLANNGKIYCVPYTQNKVLCIDPATDTTTLIGTDYGTAAAKWTDGVLHSNGKIYCVPNTSYGQVLVIDPATDTTSLIGPNFGTGVAKWTGACIGPDGKIYCPPFEAQQTLMIDPIAGVVKQIGSYHTAAIGKWFGTVLADNGSMYAVPYTANYVLKMDFVDKEENRPSIIAKFIGNNFGTTVRKTTSGTLAYDGNIYCPPLDGNYVLKINPEAQTAIQIGTDYGTAIATKYHGSVLHPNGKIYCPPANASQVLIIDPVTGITSLMGTAYTANVGKWSNPVLAPNGKIYCTPYFSGVTQILEIDPMTNTTNLVGASLGANNYKFWMFSLAPNGKLYAYSSQGATNCQMMEFDPDSKAINFYGTYSAKIFMQILAPNGKIYTGVSAGKFITFDPETKEFETIDSGIANASTSCLGIASNGRIYGVDGSGSSANQIWEIDPETNILRQVGLISNPSGGSAYYNLTLALNGKLYGGPISIAQVLEIETFPKTNDFGAYLNLPALLL